MPVGIDFDSQRLTAAIRLAGSTGRYHLAVAGGSKIDQIQQDKNNEPFNVGTLVKQIGDDENAAQMCKMP